MAIVDSESSSGSTGSCAGNRASGTRTSFYDNHQVDEPGRPEDGYHLSKDLADMAIEFIRDAKAVALGIRF